MIRAKFFVSGIELFSHPEGSGKVRLGAVYASTPGRDGNAVEENRIFGQYTPSATIDMHIHNPAAFDQFVAAFKAKKHFYVDFTEAPE